MSVAWRAIFGNDHPVEVEIGPERGLFLLAMAALHPERNFFGIERSTTRTRLIEAALAGRALPNARVVSADAHCVLRHCVPAASVSAYHIYFPDPWWKRRHQRRRLLIPEFALLLERTLVPGGMLHLITDVREIFDLALASLQSTSNLIPDDHAPPRPVRTAFEQKALRRGRPLHAVTFRRVPDASPRL